MLKQRILLSLVGLTRSGHPPRSNHFLPSISNAVIRLPSLAVYLSLHLTELGEEGKKEEILGPKERREWQ